MTNYWRSKLIPRMRKLLDPTGKKAAAVEFCKSFDGSKEEINKEIEEKKAELEPKVVEIYEASPADIKTLVKERKKAVLKKHPAEVTKFLEELVKIEFPGSKQVSEAAAISDPALVYRPIFFLFEKVAAFLPVVETPKEAPVAEPAPAAAAVEETTREVVAEEEEKKKEEEEEKKEEEIVEKVEATTSAEPAPASADPSPVQPPVEPAAEPAKPEEPPKP